jgi:TonB family protein
VPTLRTGNQNNPPPALGLLHQALAAPLPFRGQIQSIGKQGNLLTLTSEQRDIEGLSLQCYDIRSSHSQSANVGSSYCFDASGTLSRYSITFGPLLSLGTAIVTNLYHYEDRILPGDLEIRRVAERNGLERKVLTVHIERVEPLTDDDRAEMTPPPDAKPANPGPMVGFAAPMSPQPPAPGAPGVLFGSGPQAIATPPSEINISAGVAVGMLVKKVDPVYPPEAAAARVSGTVVLQVTINKEGNVDDLHVVSGPAMLQEAALEAVKQWKYGQFFQNNQPMEIHTTVDVIFTLPNP